MVDIVNIDGSQRADLSSEYLESNTSWPPLLRNDYISIDQDNLTLFENDQRLAAAVNQNSENIDRLESLTSGLENNISKNRVSINRNSTEIQRAVALSVSW